MALSKFNVDVRNISALSDQPNDNEGITADALKALYDKAGVDIKYFINNILIPEAEALIAAAAQGISSEGLDGNLIEDNSIPSDKLLQTEGSEAVTTESIREKAVTIAKLSLEVQNILSELQSDVVTLTDRLGTKAELSALASVALTGSYANLSNKPTIPAVDSSLSTSSNNAIRNSAVATAINNLTTTVSGHTTSINTINSTLSGKQAAKKTATASLSSGAKSWTVSVTGVTASNAVVCAPAPASYAQWVDHRIRCTAQSAGKLTFTADTNITAAVTVNVLIFD